MDALYDLCVIGAGTAGFTAAAAARDAGASVVLVSGPGDLGGTCILRGCMPAKTLLSATERFGDVNHADRLGVHVAAERLDLREVIARKRELVDYFAADRAHELESYPLVRERARFIAEDTVVAGETTLRARVRHRDRIGDRATADPGPHAGVLFHERRRVGDDPPAASHCRHRRRARGL